MEELRKNFYFDENIAYTEDDVQVYNLWVEDIPMTITNDEVQHYFTKFGKVARVGLRMSRGKRSAEKVGFIDFVTAEAAAAALKENDHRIGSRRILLKARDSWRQPGPHYKGHKSTNITQLDHKCLGKIFKHLQLKDQVNFARTCEHICRAFEEYAREAHKRLMVGQFNEMTLWEVRELFRRVGHCIEVIEGTLPEKFRDRMPEFMNGYIPLVREVTLNWYQCELKMPFLRRFFMAIRYVRELKFSACKFSEKAIGLMSVQLLSLESLAITHNNTFTGRELSKLENLKELSLYKCTNIFPQHLVDACKTMHKLQVLDLRCGVRLPRTAFQDMTKHLNKLEILKLSHIDIPHQSLGNLPCLKYLEILDCLKDPLTQANLFKALVQNAVTLEGLKVIASNYMTCELAKITSQLFLKTLSFPNNADLDDDCLTQLGQSKYLEEVDISNCKAITDTGLLRLLRGCKELKRVYVRNCSKITERFVYDAIQLLRREWAERNLSIGPILFFVKGTNISVKIYENNVYIAAESSLKLVFDEPASVETFKPKPESSRIQM